MDPTAETDAPPRPAGRAAGTDAERRAAVHLRDRIEACRHTASVEHLDVRPRYGLLHVGHVLLAITGGVAGVSRPGLGSALVGLALVSTLLDVSGALGRPARILTPRRASQNVCAGQRTARPGLLVLSAHIDSPRAAPSFELARRLLRDPWRAEAVAMAVVLGCCLVRGAGVDATLLTAIQFAPTVILILLLPAFADIELSAAGSDPGAWSAAESAVDLFDELAGRLEHFDLQLLLTGAASPFGLGMSGWVRSRRPALDRSTTAIIALERVGGRPRYARRQGAIFARAAHPDLLRLCEEIAEDGAEGDRPLGGVSRTPGDAAAARARRLPALAIWSEGDGGADPEACVSLCRELILRLDAEVGPRLAGRATAP